MSPHHNVKVALQSLSFLACRGLGGDLGGGGGGGGGVPALISTFENFY